MTREEKIDHMDSCRKDAFKLIPSNELKSFEVSTLAMKDFLVHADGLHFYAKLEDLKTNREKSTMIYGFRDVGSSEVEFFMIRGGLIEGDRRGRTMSIECE